METGHNEQVLEWKKHNGAVLEGDIINVSKCMSNVCGKHACSVTSIILLYMRCSILWCYKVLL